MTHSPASFVTTARAIAFAAAVFAFTPAIPLTVAQPLAPPPPHGQAALNLGEPRRCIPESGQQICDPVRTRLWQGDAEAWAAQGISDPDGRFDETVVLRVRSGDPAAISNIARLLGTPYLKVTRVRFVEDEFVEVTNLGGGPQDMTGWSLRSPARSQFNGVFPFPSDTVLRPGERCTLYTGPQRNSPPGVCEWRTYSVRLPPGGWWPDDAGEVVLFYDALGLPGDDTFYRADPNNQPPPPNLRLVDVSLER